MSAQTLRNWVRLAEKNRIPYDKDIKYINPRINFDGIHWWISAGIEWSDNISIPQNEGVGIDLGISDLAICSDIDKPYKNINKTKKRKKLEKKKRKLKRKVSIKYLINQKGRIKNECKYSNSGIATSRRRRNHSHCR